MNKGQSFELLEAAVKAHGQGRNQEAYSLYYKVLSLEPNNLEALKRLSVLLLQMGRGSEAYSFTKRAMRIRPKSRSVMEIFGAAAMANRDFAMAVRVFEPLAKNKPVNPVYLAELSKAEFELQNFRRAIAWYREYLTHFPKPKPEDFLVLGRLYFLNRQPDEAAEWLDKALEAGLETSEILAIRANCYLHEGQKEKALKLFERSIELDPDNPEAHFQHRNLIETKKGDPIFAHLEGLKSNSKITGNPEINLYFLLGKLYQRVGEDEKAFENYVIANQKVNAFYGRFYANYSPGETKEDFERLKKAFSRDELATINFSGNPTEVPVFIVGLPRSGTTLLEQIIAAHPEAEGRGEVDAMHYIHVEMEEGLKKGKSLQGLLEEKGRQWQKDYLAALNQGKNIHRITDKLPANIRSLGLISLLFPKARIIHIRRNPLDVGFSIFSNPLGTGHPYSTDLKNIGDYIRQTLDLAAFWQKEIQAPFLDLAYEDLVTQQETETRRVIEFLGLGWNPACLDFHTREKVAMTLSSTQVRKPLTGKSIGRWKRFEKRLGPLEEGLGKTLTKKAREMK